MLSPDSSDSDEDDETDQKTSKIPDQNHNNLDNSSPPTPPQFADEDKFNAGGSKRTVVPFLLTLQGEDGIQRYCDSKYVIALYRHDSHCSIAVWSTSKLQIQ